jgi:ATP-dependent Lon protease
MEAVLATLQDNYVKPDEANAAQSKVATKGKHRFIDKVHVRYVEKEKRHWAALENFNSQRIAIGEKFYRDNDRLLEGGIWAEVTLPQRHRGRRLRVLRRGPAPDPAEPLSTSTATAKAERSSPATSGSTSALGRAGAGKLSQTRAEMHFIARLARWWSRTTTTSSWARAAPGKSYFFSEFSPYAT